jgi:hypothetical protein
MTLICKKKEKLTLGCIQNYGYVMPRTFINSISTKCLSMINMLIAIEHWAFTHVMMPRKHPCILVD